MKCAKMTKQTVSCLISSKAISDLIDTLGWDYVSTFHSENAADFAAYEAFKSVVESTRICISKSESVKSKDVSDDSFNSLVGKFFTNLGPNVTILFLPPDQLAQFFQAYGSRVGSNRDTQFIIAYRGSTNLDSSVLSGLSDSTVNSLIGITPSLLRPGTSDAFDNFFKALAPDSYDPMADPWFRTFWQNAYQCNLDGGSDFPTNCTSDHVQQHIDSYQRHPYVPAVLDSIKVFIEALKNVHQDLCGGSGFCDSLQQLSADYFYSNITQVSTTGSANQQIRYKASGDLAANKFSFINFSNDQEVNSFSTTNAICYFIRNVIIDK